MLFSSGTLGRFSTILTGTLANPSMYCSGHNNLPPLRLPREGKLIIPETFKLFPDISLAYQRKDDEDRRRVADELTADAQELGMGY